MVYGDVIGWALMGPRRLDTQYGRKAAYAVAININNVGRSKGVGRAKSKKGVSRTSETAFADQLKSASGPSEASGLTDSGIVENVTVEGVDAILAMQEAGSSTEEKTRSKQAQAYGEDLLGKLALIQDGLLSGAIPKSQLADIAHKIRTGRTQVQDPKLNELLDEIELRAEVELAKYTRKL